MQTNKYQKGPKGLQNDDLEQESKSIKIFGLFRMYPLMSKD